MNCQQRTLEGFPQPWSNKIKSISKLSKPRKQHRWNTLHIGDSRMTTGSLPPFLGTDAIGLLGAALSLSLSVFPRYQKKKGYWRQLFHPLSPIPLHPNWLSTWVYIPLSYVNIIRNTFIISKMKMEFLWCGQLVLQ